jgi:hypothetical protein
MDINMSKYPDLADLFVLAEMPIGISARARASVRRPQREAICWTVRAALVMTAATSFG